MPHTKKRSRSRIPRLNIIIRSTLGETLPSYIEGEPGLITVTKVEVSGDLKWAKVWVSILGGDDDRIFAILNKNIYHIQGEVNRVLPIKVLPRIQFFLDTSSRHAARISEVLSNIIETPE